MFKINTETPKRRHWTYVSVSIADTEQIIVSWVLSDSTFFRFVLNKLITKFAANFDFDVIKWIHHVTIYL